MAPCAPSSRSTLDSLGSHAIVGPGAKTYTLIGCDGKPYASAMPGTLGGHRGAKIYGTLDCPGARSWIARGHYVTQRVFFADEESAIAAGYRPCARCMPQAHAQWQAAQERRRCSPRDDSGGDDQDGGASSAPGW